MGKKTVKKVDLHNIDLFHEANIYSPTRTVYFGGTPYTADEVDSISVAQTIKNLQILEYQDRGQPINLILNSCGGDWFSGVGLYDIIKSLTSPVIIVGVGQIFSMGSVILQAGDLRVLTKHSTVMCHAGEDGFSGHPKAFLRWADNTKEVNKQCCKIYREQMIKKNPKITLGQIDKLFEHDAIYTAEQAVKIGLADTIMEYVSKDFNNLQT